MEQEEKLERIYRDFESSLKKIAEIAIGDMVSEFIPYAEVDHAANVYTKANSLVNAFLADKPLPDGSSKEDVFASVVSKEVREKIFEEFKNEIVNDIIRDLEEEIKGLKDQVKWYQIMRNLN